MQYPRDFGTPSRTLVTKHPVVSGSISLSHGSWAGLVGTNIQLLSITGKIVTLKVSSLVDTFPTITITLVAP